jgi:RHS repeat-associated protein
MRFSRYRFTGKERDAESGLDYFGARYLSSDLGRWMTPDWAAKPTDVPYATFGDPQTLNLYAYVGNNPNTGIDVDGHVSENNTSDPGTQDSFCTTEDTCNNLNGTSGSSSNGGSPSGQNSDSSNPPAPPGAQQQIHTETTITVHANTHWWNKVGSFFGKAEHGIAYGMTAFIITHSHWAMENNKSGFEYWSKQSNEDIIKSLNPGGKEPMQVRTEVDSEGGMNFRVLNGNTRLGILQSRGADLGGLNPEALPPVMQLEPLGMPKTGSGAGAETEPEPLEFPE